MVHSKSLVPLDQGLHHYRNYLYQLQLIIQSTRINDATVELLAVLMAVHLVDMLATSKVVRKVVLRADQWVVTSGYVLVETKEKLVAASRVEWLVCETAELWAVQSDPWTVAKKAHSSAVYLAA